MSWSEAALLLYGLASRRLGWRPDEFWRATPAELLVALAEPTAVAAPLDRTTLQRMMEHDGG